MARVTKNVLKHQFISIYNECLDIYNGELEKLLNRKQLKKVAYYYILNPHKLHAVRKFFGLDNDKYCMIDNDNKYTLLQYQKALNDLQEHKEELKQVIIRGGISE